MQTDIEERFKLQHKRPGKREATTNNRLFRTFKNMYMTWVVGLLLSMNIARWKRVSLLKQSFQCVCVHTQTCVFVYIHVDVTGGQESESPPWSWRYRHLWTIQNGCLDLNSQDSTTNVLHCWVTSPVLRKCSKPWTTSLLLETVNREKSPKKMEENWTIVSEICQISRN